MNSWDPESKDWDKTKPQSAAVLRVQRDLLAISREPGPGIVVVNEKDNLLKLNSIIVGPFDTPYEGGFFHFSLRCPNDYPINSPRVRLNTTGDGKVRFNPNLYANGKVCLSIIGTWSGPAWSPALTLSSLLLSIQSLMSENPYHNEPGYEKSNTSLSGKLVTTSKTTHEAASKIYNDIIRHETIRIAVCDNIEKILNNKTEIPETLHSVCLKSFLLFYDYYMDVCEKNSVPNGKLMNDPFGDKRGKFDYISLRNRLERCRPEVEQKIKSMKPVNENEEGIK